MRLIFSKRGVSHQDRLLEYRAAAVCIVSRTNVQIIYTHKFSFFQRIELISLYLVATEA